MKLLKSMADRLVAKTIKNRIAGSYTIYGLASKIVAAYENRDGSISTNGERWLIRRLAKNGIETVIDAGANEGEWAAVVREHAPQAHVFCCEPVPDTFAVLQVVVEARSVEMINKALSSAPGTLTIYAVAENSHISSASAGDLFQPHLAREAVEVPATTGDLLMEEYDLRHVDMVKIDTEGHDFDVLCGFGRALEEGRIDLIQFEYNVLTLEAGRALHDFFELLMPGYLLCRLLPNGLEACGYHASLDNFAQSNWVAVRINALNRSLVADLSIRRARGLAGHHLDEILNANSRLRELI